MVPHLADATPSGIGRSGYFEPFLAASAAKRLQPVAVVSKRAL